ncbi:hypothetical protein IFR05_007328 [Cadophora sp. M221]|nr:hypothetical protein IFR05_007328 [Cadophora sp. M221]
MATDNFNNHEHQVYTRDEDLPFSPDGNDTFIGDRVERVKERRVIGSSGNMLYARKTITINKQNKRAHLQEARTLHRARHGHVVKLIMTYFYEREQDIRFAIIMERADGNLDAYLTGKMSRKKTRNLSRWFGCLVGVVAYIHGLGIRHRDIKPSNILIKDEQVLLADFGISKMGLGKTMPTTIPALPRARTQSYCAPEVESGSTRGRSADVFSLGAVFLEMLIAYSYPAKRQQLEGILSSRGSRSYAKNVDLVHQMIDDIRDSRPDDWVLILVSHIRNMLHTKRDQRPLADELDSAWLCLLPKDEPLAPCICFRMVAAGNDKMIEFCKTGLLPEVRRLLVSGIDPNIIGAIHQASARGFAKIVELFLDHEVDVNLQDDNKQTALHCAAGYGYKEIVEMLLDRNANVGLQDDDGQTALHCAAGHGNMSIVQMLLAKGADVQASNDEGQIALDCAARRGHNDVVRLLLDRTAISNPMAQDSVGRTVLDCVVGYGSEVVAGRLAEFLSKDTMDLQDKHGLSSLHSVTRGVGLESTTTTSADY